MFTRLCIWLYVYYRSICPLVYVDACVMTDMSVSNTKLKGILRLHVCSRKSIGLSTHKYNNNNNNNNNHNHFPQPPIWEIFIQFKTTESNIL